MEMEVEWVLIKEIQGIEQMIASTLSNCEKKVDDELMDLICRMPERQTEGMLMPNNLVVSRVVEKLLSLLHQEPTALVGVEEQVEWIERDLRSTPWYGDGHEFRVELGDVAYDLEVSLDNLLFRSAAQEGAKGKPSTLPAPSSSEFSPLDPPLHDSEEIIEGSTTLQSLNTLHLKMKKAARRIQDKLWLMVGFLRDFESDELVMKELLSITRSAVDVIEELISRREQSRRSFREQGVLDMDNLKAEHKVAMEMEIICSKIKKGISGLSERAFPNQRKKWYVDLPKVEVDTLTRFIGLWGDVENMTKSVASRAIEKLTTLLVQEPVALFGLEERVQWIQKELKGIVSRRRFTEEAIDVAYDVEDYIDNLVLLPASQAKSGEDVITSDHNHLQEKLERIMYKIQALPPPALQYCMDHRAPITETDWLQLSSALDQSPANTVVSPVIAKITTLLAQGSLPPRVNKSARRVQDKFKLMNGFLEALESEALDDRGMAWMEELCHVSLSTVDLIDQFMKSKLQEKGSSSISVGPLGRDVLGFAHLISQHKLARKMDHIYAKISGLSISRPEQSHGPNTKKTVPRSLPPNPSEDDYADHQEPDVVSFGDDIHAIMTGLLSDDTSFSVISIVGMPGIGKTTLAKLIYNNKAVVDHFSFRAWSSATDWDEFLRDLLGQPINSEGPRSWTRINTMIQKLIAFLTGKKYLIVLEDASTIVFLNELVTTLHGASKNGSRMILTSRTMTVASSLERGTVHCVRLRVDDESWALFTHVMKGNMSPEMQRLKREIVRRCGGLPLAVVKLANALSQKDATYSSALYQLNQDQQQLWSYTLSRINDDLPLYMQRCLYYFSLFPQDYEIPTRRLILLWVAEGLVKNEETPEVVAERYLTALIGKAMVRVTKNKLNGNVKTCVLPDALRQYWSSKSLRTTFLQAGTGSIRRLADHLDKAGVSFDHIHGNYKTTSASLQPLYQELVSFLSFDTREGSNPGKDIKNFLHRCISNRCLLLLRVLDLENTFKPKLPEELGKLTQLRYLGLRSTFLDVLPSSVSKLQSLQTLDIKHTNINTLPSSIWNLQQIRQLCLNGRSLIQIMPQKLSVGSSSPLQVLIGLLVDDETPVKDGLNRFLNIRKLGLTCSLPSSSKQEVVVEWISKLEGLQSFRLKSISEENLAGVIELRSLANHINLSCLYLLGKLKNPSMVSELPHSLIDLTLSGSELEEDPMQILDKLPKLKVLRLFAKSYTGMSMVCSPGGFPQLQVLKVWKLEELEEWSVDDGALQALWDLEIRSCRRLKMLPQVLHCRARLELKLADMPSQFITTKS